MAKLQVKGQSSVEYLLIVALTFAVIVPTTYFFYQYSRDSSQEVADAQLTSLGRELIDTAEKIFYSGIGSRTMMRVSIPEGVTSAVIIDGKELVFNITSAIGTSEVVFFSDVNLTTATSMCNGNVCTINDFSKQGVKNIRIEAVSKNSVRIDTI